jgi:hypothetical protein
MVTCNIVGTLYHAKWCGHCTDFKPEWDLLKDKIKQLGGKFKGNTILINDFEDSQLPKEGAKINNTDIRGYPTVKISVSTNGKVIEYEYDGKRKAADLFYHITNDAVNNLK